VGTPFTPPDIIQALTPVVEALEAQGVPYCVGGSVASSVHGRARATQDIDVVADLTLAQVAPFVQHLQSDYYVDAGMVQDAIRRRGSFNVLHNGTGVKVDIFVKKTGTFADQEMQRATLGLLAPGTRPFVLASSEDMVLAKLDWWQQGGGHSTRQWSDLVEILKRQQAQLDRAYLQQMATQLGIAPLLAQALADAGM
jgi:hypothetical protein